MFKFSFLRAFGFAAVFAVSLSGCSVHGSYPDFSGPDSAKLRFISDMESATLDLFDAEHCDGRTTGILNNLFLANTRRRADMIAPPVPGAKAYLEIQLKPGAELLLRTNSQSRNVLCGTTFNFTPQSGAEYELDFFDAGSQCRASLSRLSLVDDKIVRSPIPLAEKGLKSCTGHNLIFPNAVPALPSTPERTALIDQIIAKSIIEQMKPQLHAADSVPKAETLDKTVADRKRLMAINLPDAYWAEYRQNASVFVTEVINLKKRALRLYKDQYRARLQRLDTAEIKTLLIDSDTVDLTKALATNKEMLEFYHGITRQTLKESLSDNLNRMADLDKRYDVCERFAGCWKN